MPPPAIRLIATIFLGLPGLALWLGGLIAIGMMAALITSTTTAHWEEVAIISVCGLLASIGGSAMIKGWRLFIQGNRHHLPISRITLITAVAVAAQILAVIALSCLVPGAYQLLEIGRKEGMLPLAISGVSLLLSIFLHRLGFDLRLKWEREHSATLRAWKEAAHTAALPRHPE
jgi:hypothetical protein